MLGPTMALDPAKLSDFRLGDPLGMGASARVYAAVHKASGQPVAIKVMERDALVDSTEMRERFAREALLLSGVESRYVAKILGFGFEKGQPFLVLERFDGETLDAKLRRDGPVPPSMAVYWVEQLIGGVRDCHAAHVIHRDIKPSNIFLHRDGPDETVKLIDFGLARLRQISVETGLTSPGHLIGSMGYMAPEQFEDAKAVGWPADLYAVGVVVFRMFTGRLPFVSRSIEAVIRMKTEDPVPNVSSFASVASARLDAFVHKAMARLPANRFQSAREMLEEWWNVVDSIEEEDATMTTRRMIHRLEESHAGRISRATIPPETQPLYSVASDDEQATKRALATNLGHELAREQAPRTVPSHGLGPGDTDGEVEVVFEPDPDEPDPFDVPTRNDPHLRRLVQRELELYRSRKPRK